MNADLRAELSGSLCVAMELAKNPLEVLGFRFVVWLRRTSRDAVDKMQRHLRSSGDERGCRECSVRCVREIGSA